MKKIALLLGVHAHQPVGNFPEVLRDAHERCYRPFIQTLHRYPKFPFALHFSGWLLDYLSQHFPQDMALLKEMVARGQVEMVGAGDTEPVLAVIPARDRVGQVNALSEKLERQFGQRPQGAWLTERVGRPPWSPRWRTRASATLPWTITTSCAAGGRWRYCGLFSTEEDGRRLDLFPISEALRYRFPFSPAAEAVHYLESLAGEGEDAAIYFDDIEKFGIWPETYDWVYEAAGWSLRPGRAGLAAHPHHEFRRLPRRAHTPAAWSTCPPLRISR